MRSARVAVHCGFGGATRFACFRWPHEPLHPDKNPRPNSGHFQENGQRILGTTIVVFSAYNPTHSLWAGYGENSDEMHAVVANLGCPEEETHPLKKLAAIAAGIVLATGLAAGLAACGTTAPSARTAVATVTVAPTPTVTKTVISTPAAPAPELVNAQAVVTQFYGDLNDGDFADAWNIGGDNIAGTDYDAWVTGFADTNWVSLDSWGYFGSDEVTVDLTAPQADGSVLTYQGTYTVESGVIVSASIIETSLRGSFTTASAGLPQGLHLVGRWAGSRAGRSTATCTGRS